MYLHEDTVISLGSVIDVIEEESGEFVVDPPMNFLIRRQMTAKA